jgi:hypothetical protein
MLLILVERQAVNMDFRQLQHIFQVVILMSSLVTSHSVRRGRQEQHTKDTAQDNVLKIMQV